MIRILISSVTVCLLTMLTAVNHGWAAAPDQEPQRWKTCVTLMPIGPAWPGPGSYGLASVRGSVSFGKNNHWLTVAASYLYVLDLSFDILGPPVPPDRYSDIGLLYGRRFLESHSGYIFAAAGVARSHGQYETTVSTGDGMWYGQHRVQKQVSMWSVPLDLRAFAKPTDHFGIGIAWFEYLNSVRSYGGVTLGIAVEY